MNLARNLERSAFFFGGRPAISESGRETSYSELNASANRVATWLLKMGVNNGDRIGLCAPNSSDWLAFYFGTIKAGATAVTFSPLLKKEELEMLIGHSRPKMVLGTEERFDHLSDLVKSGMIEKVICKGAETSPDFVFEEGSPNFEAIDQERDHTAAILYTGGTTGIPKGVMLTHESINAAIHTVIYNESSTEKDRALCFLPFNHVFGQNHIMNATILSGGCLEMLPAFDLDRVLYLLGKGGITKLFAVPTVYVRLLTLERLKERLGAVSYCFSAAASMAAEIVKQWKEQTELSIFEGYGMTEASPCVTFNHHYRHVIGSVGTEVAGVEVQLRDESGNRVGKGEKGEICVRGPNVMKGYLNNPEGTKAAFWDGGWLRTGDVGRFDDDGYLYIVDRIKDMIITGGENVYPREVEEILYRRNEIQECAVVGFPDAEWGEKVTAFLVPRAGAVIDENAVKAFLKEHLSSFKVPKAFYVVKELPKTAAGKISKLELRQEVSNDR